MRTTNDRTPSSRRNRATRSLIVSISSRNSRPATPDGVTISGVPSSVRPMKATLTLVLPTRLISYGGSGVSSVPSRNTFADRYWKNAPLNGSPSWQPSIGWQPPFCIRSSSFDPSSNSWLPTPVTSSPSSFMASIVGSSWSNAEMSGLAPIRSPAPTVIVFGFRSRRRSIQVARYSTPPASTVVVGPVWIRPPDPLGGSRLPWKSLMASSWTLVCPSDCADALDGRAAIIAATAATVTTTLLIALSSGGCARHYAQQEGQLNDRCASRASDVRRR